MYWQRTGNNYVSGRYKVTDLGSRSGAHRWKLTVLGVEDGWYPKLGDAKSRVEEIEQMRANDSDPYWGGKQRFYAQGKRRRKVKGWDGPLGPTPPLSE